MTIHRTNPGPDCASRKDNTKRQSRADTFRWHLYILYDYLSFHQPLGSIGDSCASSRGMVEARVVI